MQEKQLIAEHRCLKADHWLARQPLDRFLNGKQEKVIAFKARLYGWAERNDPHEIAPSFPFNGVQV